MIEAQNRKLKAALIHPDACHCTDRELRNNNRCEAFCSTTRELKGRITWFHKDNCINVGVKLPLGTTFSKKISHDLTEAEMVTELAELLTQMDNSYDG